MTNEKLLPCPFCRQSETWFGTLKMWDHTRTGGGWSVECPACQARGPERATEAEAITAWNTRFSTPPGDDEVERVARALCIAMGDDPEREGPFAEWFDSKGSALDGNYGHLARAAITAIPGRDDWRDIASAPRDGTYILARRAKLDDDDRWAHLASRCFVIRHEGKTTSGHDLGWAVYPGFGGVTDDWFECWMPLPKAPSEESAA